MSSREGLFDRATKWDQLLESCEHRVPSLSYAWVASHLEHLLAPDETWTCLFAFYRDDLLGVLPLVARPDRTAGRSCVRLATPHGLHTMSVDIACTSGCAPTVVPLLLLAMERCYPSWVEARLPRLSALSPTLRCLTSPDLEALVATDITDHGSLVRTDGTLAAYLDTLSPNFVRNISRVSRKLDKLPGSEVVFLAGRDAAPAFLDDFVRLEAAGWKGASGGAIANQARLREFYASLVARLHASGWLEWHFVRGEGRLLAAQLACRVGHQLYLWKIAFDEQYSAYSPGRLLIMRTLERAFADPEVDEVNCLTVTPWNRDWNMSQRAYHDVLAWPRRPLPLVTGYLWHRARQLLRDLPGARTAYHRVLDLKRRIIGDRGAERTDTSGDVRRAVAAPAVLPTSAG